MQAFPDRELSSHSESQAFDLRLAERAVETIRFFRRLFHSLMAFEVLYLCYLPVASLALVIVPAILLAKFLGKKVVLDYRSPVLLNRIGSRAFLYQRLWKLCDRVMVPTPYQRAFVSSIGGRADYLPPIASLKNVSAKVIRSLQPRILIVSELEREYNVACAIRAFRLVKQKYPRAELVIIGSGAQQPALERMVQSDKIQGVTFTGDLIGERRRQHYLGAELFLNCSTVDHLSSAMIEAFAFGLPVLTTPIAGVADVFPGGGSVILLTYNDHVGLADKVIRLIEEPELTEKLSRGAPEAAERYSVWASHQRSRGLYRRRQP